MLNVLIWFDVEDYITPESDDALLALCRLLEERGIRGTFKVVGEKARVLEKRDRRDVLSALRFHEIGFHTNFHSVHPTVAEYLEGLDLATGAAEFERRESPGLEAVSDIIGTTPVVYGQPGASWAPQVFPILKRWGMQLYLDVHSRVGVNGHPFWYGGMLNITQPEAVLRMELQPDGLRDAIMRFDSLASEAPDSNLLSIYYHPCEFATTEFWDAVNFARGAKPPKDRWRPAPLRTPGSQRYYLEALGSFLDHTLAMGAVYLTGTEALQGAPASTKPSPSDVPSIARMIGPDLSFIFDDRYRLSPSDIFRSLCAAFAGVAPQGDVLFGPSNHIETSAPTSIRVGELKEALRRADYLSVAGFPQLPDAFQLTSGQINPIDITCTIARALAGHASDDSKIDVVGGVLRAADYVTDNSRWSNDWIIFPSDFQATSLVELAKLQAWTLCPAQR